MQLRRLSGLERDKIESEYTELLKTIADLEDILANHDRVLKIIRDDLTEINKNMVMIEEPKLVMQALIWKMKI